MPPIKPFLACARRDTDCPPRLRVPLHRLHRLHRIPGLQQGARSSRSARSARCPPPRRTSSRREADRLGRRSSSRHRGIWRLTEAITVLTSPTRRCSSCISIAMSNMLLALDSVSDTSGSAVDAQRLGIDHSCRRRPAHVVVAGRTNGPGVPAAAAAANPPPPTPPPPPQPAPNGLCAGGLSRRAWLHLAILPLPAARGAATSGAGAGTAARADPSTPTGCRPCSRLRAPCRKSRASRGRRRR